MARGKIKKIIEEMHEDSSLLKEFNVKVTDTETNKSFVGFVKAKTPESAINKMNEGNEKFPYSYEIL